MIDEMGVAGCVEKICEIDDVATVAEIVKQYHAIF